MMDLYYTHTHTYPVQTKHICRLESLVLPVCAARTWPRTVFVLLYAYRSGLIIFWAKAKFSQFCHIKSALNNEKYSAGFFWRPLTILICTMKYSSLDAASGVVYFCPFSIVLVRKQKMVNSVIYAAFCTL